MVQDTDHNMAVKASRGTGVAMLHAASLWVGATY